MPPAIKTAIQKPSTIHLVTGPVSLPAICMCMEGSFCYLNGGSAIARSLRRVIRWVYGDSP